jgi:hypothetical protein
MRVHLVAVIDRFGESGSIERLVPSSSPMAGAI